MQAAWQNFGIIILVQFIFFIVQAYYTKKLSTVVRVLEQGAVIGIVMGLLFDFVLGKTLGLHSYILGFGVFFLVINSALSYGLFAANILLMEQLRLRYFFPCLVALVAAYEIANHFYPVWTWQFTLAPLEFFTVLLLGYFAGAVFVAITSHAFFKRRFYIIDAVLKK